MKQIIIQSSRVSGTGSLTDFPVLFSVTDPDLRSTGNGGNVENTSGYDIIFSLDDCSQILDHEIESYDPTNGNLVAWIRIPSLSATTNTTIRMVYGNPNIVADPSLTSTWDGNYLGVYHFNGNVQDATNQTDFTDHSTTNYANGKIAAARNLNNFNNVASSSGAGIYLSLPNAYFSGINDFSFEGWVEMDRVNTNWERIFDFGEGTTRNFFLTPSHGAGNPGQTRARITDNGNGNEEGPIVNNTGTITGNWFHWAVTIDVTSSTMTLYRNGAFYGSDTGLTLVPDDLEATDDNYFGRSQYGADHYIDGRFDEFRLSNTARSADWIATSYNNQDNPATFYSVLTETSATVSCATLPIELYSFECSLVDVSNVKLEWVTGEETNNDYFTVQRSSNEKDWEDILKLKGAGNSSEILTYTEFDHNPMQGHNYYRIKQTDFNGEYSYSPVRLVKVDYDPHISVFPNPAKDKFNVNFMGINQYKIELFNAFSQKMEISYKTQNNSVQIETRGLENGIYMLVITKGELIFKKKILIID